MGVLLLLLNCRGLHLSLERSHSSQDIYTVPLPSSSLANPLFFDERRSRCASRGKEQVEVQGTRRRVDQVAGSLAGEDWQILSAGAGSKGPRVFAWARVELAAPAINGWQRWLLVRRSLDGGAKPAEMAYVLVFSPAETSLEEMVEAFGVRWTVEQCFEEAKGEAGMDEYEVRSWHGWYRHVTLSILAMTFLTVLRANEGENAPEKPEQTLRIPESGANDPAQTQASSDLPVMVPLSVA